MVVELYVIRTANNRDLTENYRAAFVVRGPSRRVLVRQVLGYKRLLYMELDIFNFSGAPLYTLP